MELIASQGSLKDVQRAREVDSLTYLDQADLVTALGRLEAWGIEQFKTYLRPMLEAPPGTSRYRIKQALESSRPERHRFACFDGNYIPFQTWCRCLPEPNRTIRSFFWNQPTWYTLSVEPEAFEKLVLEAIESVPKRFRDKLENVAFVVESEHRPPMRGERSIFRRGTLLGLYQGIPYGKRGPWYSGALPDKITLFQDTIEAYGGFHPIRIQKIVRDTVHHEIGHYFGMSEKEVRSWEHKRRAR